MSEHRDSGDYTVDADSNLILADPVVFKWLNELRAENELLKKVAEAADFYLENHYSANFTQLRKALDAWKAAFP